MIQHTEAYFLPVSWFITNKIHCASFSLLFARSCPNDVVFTLYSDRNRLVILSWFGEKFTLPYFFIYIRFWLVHFYMYNTLLFSLYWPSSGNTVKMKEWSPSGVPKFVCFMLPVHELLYVFRRYQTVSFVSYFDICCLCYYTCHWL